MIEMCLIVNLLFQIKLYMCIYYNKLFCDVFINVLYIIILQSLYTQWSICYLILVKNSIRLELIMRQNRFWSIILCIYDKQVWHWYYHMI